MSNEDAPLPIPNGKVPQNYFVLSNSRLSHLHNEARSALVKGIQDDEMAPYYLSLPSLTPPLLSGDALNKLKEANTKTLETLDAALSSAYDTEGESEISDALRARANYLTKIGDKDKAVEAQKLALEKTPGLGARIDIVLTLVRIGFFFNDQEIIRTYMKKAEGLVEEGGDWDRRNRLKVYSGLQLLSIRQFDRAATLFVDALPTFTASELLDYNDFVTLTVIAGTLVLKRPDLKKKIISSPEVNQVLPEIPALSDFTKSLYNCDYAKFFVSLAALEQTYLLPSRILSPHARYYVREMRILAYAQLLESYRSLTLQSMSTAFGVGVEFVDKDLQKFISSGRLNCTIDKVHGIVETNRPSSKNAQYETVVRQGDLLLNSVQKLSKVCMAIKEVANRLIGKDVEALFEDMGKTWDYLLADPQLRWYITDAISKEEALAMLREREASKAQREALVRKIGYPAYITSAGWLRYDDEKVARLVREAIGAGFTHFKMKVGANFEDDYRRANLIRSIIDNPSSFPEGYSPPTAGSLQGKNAGPMGCVLMMDANQVWDVDEAVKYTKGLASAKPWFIEEPTAPDDILGHAAIRKALKPDGIGVATGEHAHNRMTFKQLLQAEAIDVCQIDACRLAGVTEILSVLLMAT
ncbi:hypothetical protein FS837_007895, partial [Tulasnella sp. UAMH 9824]